MSQLLRRPERNCNVVLVSSVGKVSDYDRFQLAESIVRDRVQPRAEYAKTACSLRVRIAQATDAPNVGCN